MIRLTPLGKLFLLILALLYGASLTSQSGLLLFLIGLLLGCFFVNLAAARSAANAIRLSAPPIIQVAEGERLTEPWKIENSAPQSAHNLEIRNKDAAVLLHSGLPPKTSQNVVPNLFFSRRGAFLNSDLTVISTDPFGFVEARRHITVPGEIVVYPAVYLCSAPRSRGFDVMVGGKHKGPRRSAGGSNFAGVRPFQAGDSFKQIHWQSSAKGLGLMVKTFDEELSGRVAVILVTSPSDPSVFDAAARAAGSLIFAALDVGHHVEWVDLAAAKPLIIPPFADGGEILDRLARIMMREQPVEPGELSDGMKRISRRSAMHVVFPELGGASPLVEALLADRRPLSIYLPDPVAFASAEKSPPEIEGEVEIFFYTNNSIVPV